MANIIEIGSHHGDSLKKNHKTDFQKAFQYLASFPPSLPATFINMYSDEGQTVLDPFSGKGTCPLQALAMNRHAIGNDLSVVAYTYSHSRLRHISLEQAMNGIRQLRYECKNIDVNPYEFEPMLHMYHFDTLLEVLRAREYLMERRDDVSMFLKAHICGILYGSGPNDLTTDLPGTFPINLKNIKTYVDERGQKPVYKDLWLCLENKIKISMRTGVPKLKGTMFHGDASKLDEKIEARSVDLVVSSPPYINLIMYGEKTWVMQWFLGEDYREYDKLTKKIGSCSGVEDDYFNLMRRVLQSMYNVMKDNSACVFVVGGSKKDASTKGIMHIPMKFIKIGKDVGFNVKDVYTRGFQSSIRSMFDEKTRKEAGTNYQDASIVFEKGNANKRMTFEEGLNFGLMNIEDIDELANIDIEGLED